MTKPKVERKFCPRSDDQVLIEHRLINVLKAANQEVPEDLLKFGTTVKRKGHDGYGAFFKDVDTTKTAQKIKFD